jgi:hypothetical protein
LLEYNLVSKSSQKPPRQILGVLSAARAERMLTEWVNTDLACFTDANAWERLFRLYPEIPSVPSSDILPFGEKKWLLFHQQMEMAEEVAADLARAWESPDLRHFEWYTWKAQMDYEFQAASARHDLLEPGVSIENMPSAIAAITESGEPPVTITPVEAAIYHLRRNRKRALHCPNPDCPAPYFFASKKGQKYCSLECAKPSQRESKRRWWAENRAQKVPKAGASDRRSK